MRRRWTIWGGEDGRKVGRAAVPAPPRRQKYRRQRPRRALRSLHLPTLPQTGYRPPPPRPGRPAPRSQRILLLPLRLLLRRLLPRLVAWLRRVRPHDATEG